MNIIGIDASLTSTGIVVMNEKAQVVFNAAIRSKAKGTSRLLDIESILGHAVVQHQVEKVYMEGYAFGAQASREAMGELGGVIKRWLYIRKLPVIVIPPSCVKKFACGKGNAQKDQIRLSVWKKWNFEAPTNDEVDAYVIARMGLILEGLAQPEFEYERESLKNIAKE